MGCHCYSRFNRRRSNLQDMNRLSTSCPVVDSPRLVSAEDSDSDSTESSDFEDRAGEERANFSVAFLFHSFSYK